MVKIRVVIRMLRICGVRWHALPMMVLLLCNACDQAGSTNEANLEPMMREDTISGRSSWGYVRTDYREKKALPERYIITPRYAAAKPFSSGLAAVNIGGLSYGGSSPRGGEWAFINSKGKVLMRGFKGYASSFSEGLAAVQPAADGLRGYIDTNGFMVIQPQFVIARDFSEGLAAVRAPTNHYGYINKNGELVIPPIYHLAEAFTSGVARVRLGAVDGYAERFIDRNGNFVDAK